MNMLNANKPIFILNKINFINLKFILTFNELKFTCTNFKIGSNISWKNCY